RLWTSQPTKRSIADKPPYPERNRDDENVVRGCRPGSWRSVLFLRGESTTTYASSKLNRAGRRAARYDSGLSAHKCTRPARKRPTPHRIAHGQVACSRSRCGNLSTLPLPPVNPHSQTFSGQPPLQHNHARYDAGTNQKGFRTGMTDGSGSTTWTYDLMGWVTSESRTIAGKTNSISYSWNQDGSLASITYPSGRTVTYNV